MTTATPPTIEVSEDATILMLQSSIDQAARRFQAAKRSLARDDGKPLYTDHAARLAAIQADADATFQAADARASALFQAAVAREERERRIDPIDKLTNDEIAYAGARQSFVREDCATLPLADLVLRVQDALADAPRSVQALWVRGVAARVRDLETRPQPITQQDRTAASTLHDLVRHARGRFVNERTITEAKRDQQEAAEFRADLVRRHHADTDAGAAYEAELRQRFRM